MSEVHGNTLCETCTHTLAWHEEHHPRHPFKHNGMPVTNVFSKKKRPEQPGPSVPFDPVVRQALLDKGILTPEDFAAAEQKINAMLGAVVAEQIAGKPLWRTAKHQNMVDDRDSSSRPHMM